MNLNTKRLIVYAVFGAIAVIIMLVAFNGCAPAAQTGESFAMDTVITQTVYTNDEDVIPAVAGVFDEVAQQMSRQRSGSDIDALNNADGADVRVLPDTAALLSQCLTAARETNGAYNPALGAVLDAWGFGTKTERVPSAEELKRLTQTADYTVIRADGDTVNAGNTRIDLGGSAKGYALDLVRQKLDALGVSSALVSAGGSSILAYGEKPDGQPWRVGLRDPGGGTADYFATVDLADACISTSGIYERGFWQDGVFYHHILDPKTGMPVENGLASVSVVAENGALTDIYSTALFVMGPADGLAFANENGIGAIFVTRDGAVLRTDSFGYNFTITNHSFHEA